MFPAIGRISNVARGIRTMDIGEIIEIVEFEPDLLPESIPVSVPDSVPELEPCPS